jgi:hypothetical protein
MTKNFDYLNTDGYAERDIDRSANSGRRGLWFGSGLFRVIENVGVAVIWSKPHCPVISAANFFFSLRS